MSKFHGLDVDNESSFTFKTTTVNRRTPSKFGIKLLQHFQAVGMHAAGHVYRHRPQNRPFHQPNGNSKQLGAVGLDFCDFLVTSQHDISGGGRSPRFRLISGGKQSLFGPLKMDLPFMLAVIVIRWPLRVMRSLFCRS